jgi:hypothetical protein
MARTASEAGTKVVAQDVSVWRERVWYGCEGPLHLHTYAEGVVLELWDCAPLSATVSGYADPWWARDDAGRWWIVCTRRANARRSLPTHDTVAYGVDDEVRLRLSSLRASREVAVPVTRSLLARLGVRPYEPQGHDVLRAFLDLPLVV